MQAPLAFPELHSVAWQPHKKGSLIKPELNDLRYDEQKDDEAKPKKFFKYGKGSGGENSAFQQMMR